MGIHEGMPEKPPDLLDAIGDREIFRDVLRRVAVDEGEPLPLLDRDPPDDDARQVRLVAPVRRQDQFDKRPLLQSAPEEAEELRHLNRSGLIKCLFAVHKPARLHPW